MIDQAIECHYLDVSGDGVHFDAVIVSDDFCGLSKVNRHRKVYHALGNLMEKELHAPSIKTYTVSEWNIIHG